MWFLGSSAERSAKAGFEEVVEEREVEGDREGVRSSGWGRGRPRASSASSDEFCGVAVRRNHQFQSMKGEEGKTYWRASPSKEVPVRLVLGRRRDQTVSIEVGRGGETGNVPSSATVSIVKRENRFFLPNPPFSESRGFIPDDPPARGGEVETKRPSPSAPGSVTTTLTSSSTRRVLLGSYPAAPPTPADVLLLLVSEALPAPPAPPALLPLAPPPPPPPPPPESSTLAAWLTGLEYCPAASTTCTRLGMGPEMLRILREGADEEDWWGAGCEEDEEEGSESEERALPFEADECEEDHSGISASAQWGGREE